MKREFVRGFLSVLLFAAAFLALPLIAQATETRPTDPPFSTWPGPSDADEPEGEIDLANLDYPTTLGEPVLPSEEDPALENGLPPQNPDSDTKLIYPLGLMASSESLGDSVPEAVRVELSSNAHYFSSTTANGPAVVLVGVSADNACHFNSTGTGQCSYGVNGANFKPFLDDLAAQGLNVIRLWVSIVGGDTTAKPTQTTCLGAAPSAVAIPNSQAFDTDHPFLYDKSHGTQNGVGHWWLDDPAGRNKKYFDRLAAVVSYANTKNIIVEVSLFSPLTGNVGLGPYGKGHAYTSANTPLLGFTDAANFTNSDSAEYAAMKTYVWNVIHWTVDALYQYPNVYFEVANEPENVRLSTTNAAGCGNNTEEALNSIAVSKWQSSIANELRAYEAKYVTPRGPLAHTHLVAVEPSTTFGAAKFVSGGTYSAAGNVVNSHYTVINPKGDPGVPNPLSAVGLGAIKMMQMYSKQSKIFGFNETKITGGTGGACGGGGTGGSVAAGRAEAWEFLLNQGGVYDAYGYDCSGIHNCNLAANAGDPYCQIRIQMGVLRRFVTDPLVNVVYRTQTSTPLATGTPWINVGKYGTFEPSTSTFKYWAALEPTNNATNKRWLLYVHHSKNSTTVDGGYIAGTTAGGYRESNLSVCLFGAPVGDYQVRWYKNPAAAVANAPSHTDTIHWSAPPTCTAGGPNAVSLPESSPSYDYHYDYDVALLISQ